MSKSTQLRRFLDDARAEIARLTAELAAARAVPGDVEAALTHAVGCGLDAQAAMVLRTAIARAISDATAAAVGDFIDDHAKRLCEQAGESWELERTKPGCWPAAVREVLDMLVATPGGLIIDGRPRQAERAAARGTVGGLLATVPVGSIVEWQDGDGWQRVDKRIDPGTVEWWSPYDDRWVADDGYLWPSALNLPARLVPAAEADLDPATRGPLPAAK